MNTQKFEVLDYTALVKLSFRSKYWRVDHKARTDQWSKETQWLFWGIFILCVWLCTLSLKCAVLLLFFFDPHYFYYAISYKKSSWYRNTGIRPSEVTRNVGIYGEYIATMCAEENLKKHKMNGRIFNSVMIPKKDGDFNEADIVVVGNFGIQVIEAKARMGTFAGSPVGEKWTQYIGRQVYETQNPLYQNLNHCNYLSEYLYEKIPYLRSIDFINKMYNICLYGLHGVKLSMDKSKLPNMGYLVDMASPGYRDYYFSENLLSDKEVSLICDAISRISYYSREEYKRKMEERKVRQERKEFQHRYFYYIAVITTAGGNKKTVLCRDNKYYKTYYDQEDGWFKAHPNYRIDKVVQTFDSLEEALQIYKS